MRRKWLIAGGLILAMLVVAGGIVAASWSLLHPVAGVRSSLGLFRDDRYAAEGDQNERFAVDGPARLIVRSAGGDITVTGGAQGEVVVAAHRTAWGASEAQAAAELAALQVGMERDGDTITLSFEQPTELASGSSRPNTVRFTVQVPVQTEVVADTRLGDIRLAGTSARVDLRSRFGSIEVADIGGGLQANTQSGTITAKRVQAGAGEVSLVSSFGAITLESGSAASLNVQAGSGNVDLAGLNVTGAVTMTSRFGAVKLENSSAASLNIQAGSGKVDLSGLNVAGAARAESRFGELRLVQVKAASYELHTESGGITIDGAGGQVKAQSGSGAIDVLNAERADLNLEARNGAIRFAGSLGPGPHTLKSDYGDIRLALPADTALAFKLQTGFGQIRSDFATMVTGVLDRSSWEGTINDGNIHLTATTRSGSISLEKINP